MVRRSASYAYLQMCHNRPSNATEGPRPVPTRDFLHTETLRLAALQMGDLVNTPLESRYNRIARLARRALGVRAATISLLDNTREWIKAADGWDLRAS